jgi:CrcB protein
MNMILAIAFGGAFGSVLRHYAIGAIGAPWGTMAVNVLGSFLIGLLMEIMALKWQVSLEARAFLVTGLLGGFTTFSAFSFDTFKLIETGSPMTAALYVAASVAVSLAALFGAVVLVRGLA